MSWRTVVAENFPFVKKLSKPTACDEYKWSRMPLKAIYGPNAKELKEKYRCKRSAAWKFRALKPRKNEDHMDVGKSGTYCWSHLMHELTFPRREAARVEKWVNDHQDLYSEIVRKHGKGTD